VGLGGLLPATTELAAPECDVLGVGVTDDEAPPASELAALECDGVSEGEGEGEVVAVAVDVAPPATELAATTELAAPDLLIEDEGVLEAPPATELAAPGTDLLIEDEGVAPAAGVVEGVLDGGAAPLGVREKLWDPAVVVIVRYANPPLEPTMPD